MQKRHSTRVKVLGTILGLLVVTELFLEAFVYPHWM